MSIRDIASGVALAYTTLYCAIDVHKPMCGNRIIDTSKGT